MNLSELLKGKDVKVKTDMGVDVILTIANIKTNHNSRDLEPSTRENDWWPQQETWTTYTVKFTNGYSKTYSSLDEIELATNPQPSQQKD